MVFGRDARRFVFGHRVHRVAAGYTHLHRTEIVEIARHRGLSGRDALARQQFNELRLVQHRMRGDEAGDGLLALHLGGHDQTPITARP